MALFDTITNGMAEKFGLSGEQSGGLLAAVLALIADPVKGGFGGFIGRFRNAGLGDIVDSWIARGGNEPISADEVETAVGPGEIDSIATRTGLDRGTVSAAMAGMLPGVVDKLTPDGEVPDEASLRARIGNYLADWGGTAGAAAAGIGGAVGAVGDRVPNLRGVGGAVDGGGAGSILKWLIPLLLLGLVVVLGFMFCGRPNTPVNNVTVNVNANRTNANANTAKTLDSSFRIEAVDGKYRVSGVVPDQKTFDEIKAKLDAEFKPGNVDYSGLKVDATARPFAASWWGNFEKMLPSLKDWKFGTLAFAGNAVTEASGLPAAAVDQLKSLFSGWKMPDSLGAAAEAPRNLTEVTLPSGAKLQAYPGGIEDRLVKFIESDDYKNAAPDALKDKWFSFDDLNFVFGKTELAPESKRQLDNIVAILKAFPDVKIKIGGYTDKKGDDAANLKLSDGRAKAVQAALQKAGVGAQVPEAEGYGEKFATVEESASDEARKVDRKTAVRLIKG